MKRRDLVRHLLSHGCRQVRDGASHAWWTDATGTRFTAVPRHREVKTGTARGICRDLGVPPPIGGK